jgi:hypothetical protein
MSQQIPDQLTITFTRQHRRYVARCRGIEVTGAGDTLADALIELDEAVERGCAHPLRTRLLEHADLLMPEAALVTCESHADAPSGEGHCHKSSVLMSLPAGWMPGDRLSASGTDLVVW